ncbi:helix-turn-helix domain-containing protein [Nonomuraea sp. NPDC003804]|uniref:TetR/AcrR family transcriptional regulator n=1 Tax=Nonomuraea sp. NPDC003804 TaxID=3154547 RepID=UPI0033BC4741
MAAPPGAAERRARADRILDAAKDLLLRWGYRRVTIDEIAKRAGVGKGTVYLHWRSREQVFLAVGAREAVAMITEVVAAMRADAAEVALHRYMRRFFVTAMERPVLRAIFTRDADTMGAFLDSPARGPLEGAKLLASRDYLGVLAEHGLLREGVRQEDLDYALPTIAYGFFAIEPLLPPQLTLGLQDKADQLAVTLHRTFGPERTPTGADCAPAAGKVIEIFERLGRDFEQAVYGGDA